MTDTDSRQVELRSEAKQAKQWLQQHEWAKGWSRRQKRETARELAKMKRHQGRTEAAK